MSVDQQLEKHFANLPKEQRRRIEEIRAKNRHNSKSLMTIPLIGYVNGFSDETEFNNDYFGRLHLGIDEQLTKLAKEQGEYGGNAVFIFVSNHESFREILEIPSELYKSNIGLPLMAAGEQLFKPGIEHPLRAFAFKVRRGGLDRALDIYEQALILDKQPYWQSPSGGFTDTGKVADFKRSTFSTIYEAQKKAINGGENLDVYVVPVEATHEIVPEFAIDKQKVGEAKKDFIRIAATHKERDYDLRGDTLLYFRKPIWVKAYTSTGMKSDEAKEKLASDAYNSILSQRHLVATDLMAYIIDEFRNHQVNNVNDNMIISAAEGILKKSREKGVPLSPSIEDVTGKDAMKRAFLIFHSLQDHNIPFLGSINGKILDSYTGSYRVNNETAFKRYANRARQILEYHGAV